MGRREIDKVQFGNPAIFGGWLEVYEEGGLIKIRFLWPRDTLLGVEIEPFVMEVSATTFGDDVQLRAWLATTYEIFNNYWKRVMVFETQQHFRDAANFALHHLGLSAASKQDVIDDHIKQRAAELRIRMQLPVGRGRPTRWPKSELKNALLAAKPAVFSWDGLNAWLKAHYGEEKAPASGESLRQLARGYGLTLRELKRLRKNVK